MTKPPSPKTRLLTTNFAACILLLVQLLLGMAANLFATIPPIHPGANAANYFTGAASGLAWAIPDGPVWVAIHATFGLLLIVLAPTAIVQARRHSTRAAVAIATLGALAIIGAAFNGVSFLNYGHDFSSMIMAALWTLAMTCYLTGMLLAARRTTAPRLLKAPPP